MSLKRPIWEQTNLEDEGIVRQRKVQRMLLFSDENPTLAQIKSSSGRSVKGGKLKSRSAHIQTPSYGGYRKSLSQNLQIFGNFKAGEASLNLPPLSP